MLFLSYTLMWNMTIFTFLYQFMWYYYPRPYDSLLPIRHNKFLYFQVYHCWFYDIPFLCHIPSLFLFFNAKAKQGKTRRKCTDSQRNPHTHVHSPSQLANRLASIFFPSPTFFAIGFPFILWLLFRRLPLIPVGRTLTVLSPVVQFSPLQVEIHRRGKWHC